MGLITAGHIVRCVSALDLIVSNMNRKNLLQINVEDFVTDENEKSVNNFISTDVDKLLPFFSYNQASIFSGIAIAVCKRGSAKLKINSKIYEVVPNTVLTIMPYHIMEPYERSEDILVETLIFSLDFISGLPIQIDAVQMIARNPYMKVTPEEAHVLLDMHHLVVDVFRQTGNIYREQIIKNMLYALFLELYAIYKRSESDSKSVKPSRQEELTERFLKMLVTNYVEHRDPAYYADKMYVTNKYLSQVVKETTGETVFSWINKIVVIGAKNRLKVSDQSIAQVSEELNFPNPSFFGRYFKKHTGMTPLEYKKTPL